MNNKQLNDIIISYKHSTGDPDFPDDQMFSSLTDLDFIFKSLAEKCLYKYATGYFEKGKRCMVFHPMSNDNSGEEVFVYHLNTIFSAKVTKENCKI